jgi:hypothetical protein
LQDAQPAVPLDALRAVPLAEQDATAGLAAQQAKAVPPSAQDALPDAPMEPDAPQRRLREQSRDDRLEPDVQPAPNAPQAVQQDAWPERAVPWDVPQAQSQDDRQGLDDLRGAQQVQPDVQPVLNALQAVQQGARPERDVP